MNPNTLPKLPIDEYKEAIQEAVDKHDVVIIQAETGAGKSTQVPQYLMESGKKVVVTQPRRLAARTVSKRVAEEIHLKNKAALASSTRSKLEDVVGYRTAYERNDSPKNKILFCTDGLQMVRELMGKDKTDVLVIDEVHEWNENIETLVAWTRKQIAEGRKMKLVLMSATMEAEKLAQFYGEETPVISVPGRLHPVSETQIMPSETISSIKELVSKERNVLVFQPGKKEIEETICLLKRQGLDAEIMPLHGELEPKDQQKCFQSYGKPKVIVSTNVAQTSVTIPDIDAVVDSGMERRMELSQEKIEEIVLGPISQADCKQRKGRAGRTKEGEYVLASNIPIENRPEFPKAEINCRRLDQLVLRLASIGLDATQVEFFHQPDRETLEEGKKALKAIGALTAEEEVTKIGHKISKFPISVQYGRMLIEAEKYGVVDDVLTLASILEQGGIRDRSYKWREFTQETESDLLAELDLWKAAQGKKSSEMREMGIHTKSYWRAKELRKKINDNLRRLNIKRGSTGNREDILRACAAGMVDHLYQHVNRDIYRNGDGKNKRLARESVITGTPKWLIGQNPKAATHLVTMASKVDPKWLAEVAPQLVQTQRKNTRWSSEKQAIIEDEITIFNGNEIESKSAEVEESDQAPRIIGDALASGYFKLPCHEHNQAVLSELEKLFHRSAGRVARLDIRKYYQEKLEGTSSIAEARLIDDEMRLSIDDYCSDELRASIDRDFPETVTISGQEYSLEYEYYGSYSTKSFTARATMDTETIMTLTPEDIPVLGNEDEQLAITISTTDGRFGCRDISDLQERIEIDHQRSTWNRWQEKPEAELLTIEALEPLPTHQELVAQPIEYGKTVKGEPLLAYPGIKHGNEYCYENGRYIEGFRLVYHEDKETAERVHSEAETERNKAVAEIQREKDIEELLETAQQTFDEFLPEARAITERCWDANLGYTETTELSNKIREIEKLVTGGYWDKPDPRKALQMMDEMKPELQRAEKALEAKENEVPEDPNVTLGTSVAEIAAEKLGTANALIIFRTEYEADYGRARRQAAISNALAGVSSDELDRFLVLGKARDFNAVLESALDYLQSQSPQTEGQPEQGSSIPIAEIPTFGSSMGALLKAKAKPEEKKESKPKQVQKRAETKEEEKIPLTEEQRQELQRALEFSRLVAEEVLRTYPEPNPIKTKQDNRKAKLIRRLKMQSDGLEGDIKRVSAPEADTKLGKSITASTQYINELTTEIEERHGGNPNWPANYQRIINEDIPAIETDWEGKLPEAKRVELRTELIQIARSKTEETRLAVEELIAEHLE